MTDDPQRASPFAGLQMPAALACEFFAVFSRFEYALKEEGYCYVGPRGRAHPDWRTFKERCAVLSVSSEKTRLAVEYLVGNPPKVQTGAQAWTDMPLQGTTPFAQAIEAVGRVRNNLFHGGKHSPQSVPGRDEELVCAGLQVLYACLDGMPSLRETFNLYDA
jgi:hypothetical protein